MQTPSDLGLRLKKKPKKRLPAKGRRFFAARDQLAGFSYTQRHFLRA
jgi:hypothetical protein